jgi:hypothetical protein
MQLNDGVLRHVNSEALSRAGQGGFSSGFTAL